MYILLISLNNNKKKLIRKRITISKEMGKFGKFPLVSLFDYWNSFGKPLSKHHLDRNSKLYRKVSKLLPKILEKHSLQSIKNSISVYYDLVSSEDTVLKKSIPGHIVGLDEFFGFSDFTKQRMENNQIDLGIKSWFIECLKGKTLLEKTYGDYVPDYYPNLTKEFIRLWWEYSKQNKHDLSVKDINCFRRSSMKYNRWWNKNNQKLKINDFSLNIRSFIKYVFDSIKSDIKDQDWEGLVSPGWLCSDKTYMERLPVYLKEIGVLNKEKREEYYVAH